MTHLCDHLDKNHASNKLLGGNSGEMILSATLEVREFFNKLI
ncbi:Uncharacterised protein [Serratia fonticola]|jgi:hypothetical protein|nr:Uncharacterised protein [Serratia fonticola]